MKKLSDQIADWAHKEFRDFATNLMRDMKSLRALWNYLYLALYFFLCLWAALIKDTTALKTAIITTGGLVGTIFTVYVWSKRKEATEEVAGKE